MSFKIVNPVTVQLVLLAVLRPLQKSVPVTRFESDPAKSIRVCGTPSRHHIDILEIPGELEEGFQARLRSVSDRQIHSVITFTDIEAPSVLLNCANTFWDQEVGIRI